MEEATRQRHLAAKKLSEAELELRAAQFDLQAGALNAHTRYAQARRLMDEAETFAQLLLNPPMVTFCGPSWPPAA